MMHNLPRSAIAIAYPILLILGLFQSTVVHAAPPPAALQIPTPIITIDAGHDIAPVPRRLFGTGLRQNMQSGDAIRKFITDTGITLFRYPDSLDTGYTWDWEAGGVMARGGKPLVSPLAKLDVAAELSKAVKAELFFTLKIHGSSPEEAARTVAEAKKCGLGGSYWCFGNEPYFKGDKDYITREAYVELVNAYAPAMKKADPDIHLGIAWGGPYIEEQSDKGRDSFVLRSTRQWVDFVDFHFYTGRWEKKQGIDARRIMAGSMLVAEHTRKFREIFRREAPDKAERIEVHYWEWNGPPWPEVGGIQTLATALFAADTLGEMARCGVKTAIQYNLQEHACGLIPGWEQDSLASYATEPWNGKTVRPIAYALQLWSRHMGPMLVESSITGGASYSNKDWHTLVNFQGEVPMLSAHATRGEDRRSLQIMVVNRDEKNSTDVEISLKGFDPAAKARILTLTGPSALSHNDVTTRQPLYHSFEDAPDPVVKLVQTQRDGIAPAFHHVFPPHSVTVLIVPAKLPQ